MAAQDPSRGDQLLEETRCSVLEAKHKIFLSHSGAQKDFVEQLCECLEDRLHFPFFGKRSSYCWPTETDFPSFILKAAKQCHVAVIVLSEEFISSKWQMMELAAFHEAQQEGNPQLKILPLFFELSMADLDEPSIEERWMPKWKEQARVHHIKDSTSRIDLNKWSAAVKSLLKVNGLIFDNFAKSEVAYRTAIMKEIFKLSLPQLPYDTSRSATVNDQLCEILSNQFAEDKKTGTLRLGLYGTGGVGKSTMSRALCAHFQADFLGRVCHVELGEASKTLMRLKEVLSKLCSIEDDELYQIKDTYTGWKRVHNCMKQEKVFLVIDNVTDEYSLGEAREYLAAGFHHESRIMITSRSRDIVEKLLSESRYCRPMPYLTEEEVGSSEISSLLDSSMTCRPQSIQIMHSYARRVVLCEEGLSYSNLRSLNIMTNDFTIFDTAAQAQSSLSYSHPPRLKNLSFENSYSNDEGGRAEIRGLVSLERLDLSRCRTLMELPKGLGSLLGCDLDETGFTALPYLDLEDRRKRIRRCNWNVEEIRTMLKVIEEAPGVNVGPDSWDYVSEILWKRYGFDRDSNSCKNLWGALLQCYRVIRKQELKIHIEYMGNPLLRCVGCWEMNEDQRSSNEVPQTFDYKMIDRILSVKQFEEFSRICHRDADLHSSGLPRRLFQPFESSEAGSDADCDNLAMCGDSSDGCEESDGADADSESEACGGLSNGCEESDGSDADCGNLAACGDLSDGCEESDGSDSDCDNLEMCGDSSDGCEESDDQCEDEMSTLESQAEATADSHVLHVTGQSHKPCYQTGSNYAGRKRSAAMLDEDLQDDLISRVVPFVNKQIEDALKPLISVLRGRQEDEQKHQEKLLAIEEQKLALEREKLNLYNRSAIEYGASSNSCNPAIQFRGNTLVNMMGNDAHNGTQSSTPNYGVAFNVIDSRSDQAQVERSIPDGWPFHINASPLSHAQHVADSAMAQIGVSHQLSKTNGDFCNLYGTQADGGGNSNVQTNDPRKCAIVCPSIEGIDQLDANDDLPLAYDWTSSYISPEVNVGGPGMPCEESNIRFGGFT